MEYINTILEAEPQLKDLPWSSCCTRPKKTKTNQKNPEKHLDNPPKIYASQGRHMSSDGGTYPRVTVRPIPSNSPL